MCSDTTAKLSQQDSGEERVKAKSLPMNLIARTPSHVTSSTSVKIPGGQLLRKRSGQGDLRKAQTNSKFPITITMSNIWKASLQQATQSGMTTALGILKSGKVILRHTSDRVDMIKFLGERHEQFDLVTRKFVLTLCDRSGHLISTLKEEHGLNNSSLETMKQN